MRTHLGVMTVAGVWMAWGVALCGAQTTPSANPAPCTVAPQPEPCGTKPSTSAKPDAAQKFPFPGEPGSPSTPPAAPSIGGVPEAPGASGTSPSPAPAVKDDTAKKFPFPGEPGKPDLNNAGDGSSSSSSSSSADDAAPVDPSAAPDSSATGEPALKDKGTEGATTTPGRHILHRVNPVGTKLQTADEREAEDLDIAHFYTQTGDLQGAYLRSQDAVKTAPDDPDAHFALAEIAMKLNKRDEAIAEYNACLKLDPSDKQSKESRKALARLKP
jgi:hypothetical protein